MWLGVLRDVEKYTAAHQRKKRWYQVVTSLACVVVFCTTYALILPAITLENSACEIPEHTHTEACYTQVTSVSRAEPVCTVESLNLHRHDSTCYDGEGRLVCGYADYVVHQHDASCYREDGTLWCPLPEIEPHEHTESCYAVPAAAAPAEVHTHTEACYAVERGGLLCTQHVHTDACYAQTSVLVCGLEESEGHQHGEDCVDGEGNLICTVEPSEGHRHSESCYETRLELACGIESDHQHTDECYEQIRTLVCDLPTEPVETPPPAAPELICGREEILLHEHTSDCFDAAGQLICGRIEVLAHQHTDACFEVAEEAADAGVLTCPLPEDETHTHTALCYGTWELTCGLQEHTHSEECQGAAPPVLTEEEQAQVDEVVALIDALPTMEELEAQKAAFDENQDDEGYGAYLGELRAQVETAAAAYEALAESQQACVSNADKLAALEWLLDEPAFAALTDDSAFVSELSVTGSRLIPASEPAPELPLTVRNQDTIAYRLEVGTDSYTEECFSEGRVKLEFVLPLSAEQAAFDLDSMAWLDTGDGYAPVVATQVREIDGENLPCQVLTGYKLLLPPENSGSAIPGGFTEEVFVRVTDMTPDEQVGVLVSAAMEQGTWDGSCETHLAEEKLTVATEKWTVVEFLTEEQLQAIYEDFLAEVEALEARGERDRELYSLAEDLLQRLQEAFQQGRLSEERYTELYDRIYLLLYGDLDSIAEAAEGSNWVALRDSGWFEAYSQTAGFASYSLRSASAGVPALLADTDGAGTSPPPSDVQVTGWGGTKTSDDGAVSVSKTISGTELENVFDITLQVQTSMNVAEIQEEPDMAVVIVMDISNTMNSDFGGVTRYAAAMTAAENFLDQFAANNSLGISKVGYVAFNTNAHQIFGLQPCSTQEQANALKNTMRTQTGSIINASGYNESHSRFTNVEAGLAMAADMLNGVSNQNKYIIFLSDGFPTTYISSGYSGYDPYDSTGRFYDHVLNKPCLYGTSYSDEAAIRARNKAAAIKNSGTTIFAIGVDVAGQTIQEYITQSKNASGFSVVDRTGTTYEIGDASSTEAYKNWLRNSIGSGYYYDSTDSAGLSSAYDQIFEEIKHQIEEGTVADWVASDPIPTVNGTAETVEFIGFYNKTPTLVSGNLTGKHEAGGENTASFENNAISWDLKQSGYQEATSGGTTTYTYTLVYRVRLKNEAVGFGEETIYPTNDTTTLQYRTVEGTDGNLTVSDPKTVEFPIPSVQGYLADLTFTKVHSGGGALPGAAFTLSHDVENCSICRGDGTGVTIADRTAVSGTDGTVTFTNIPSGHRYVLEETGVPPGYSANGDTYQVTVAYNELTVQVLSPDGNQKEWTHSIENTVYYELPSTGGAGTTLYTVGGLLLMTAAGLLLLYNHTRRRKEDSASS